jgi:hypothetical protein
VNLMPSQRLVILLFIGILLLAALACGPSLGDPAEIVAPAVETAEVAAQGAANAAQTAAAQAGELAGTAAAVATTEGSEFIATAKAVVTPHVDTLKEKIANIEPDADGNYRATFGEDEVNIVLRLRQLLTGDIMGAAIQSQEVTFKDGSITLTGTVIEPLPGELLVRMRPSVEAGRLKLDIQESSVGGQQAPDLALEAAETAINGTLGEALDNLPAGVRLEEITVANGELTIVGSKGEGE